MRRANKSPSQRRVAVTAATTLHGASLLVLSFMLPLWAQAASDTGAPPSDFPPPYEQLALDDFASIERIEDLLEERRFRIEMIIFTRSNDTSAGEEPLLSIEPRILPKNMLALTPSASATSAALYTGSSSYCIGYPIIASEPQLPKKLRALLNKENEPELAQWFDDDILQADISATAGPFNSVLGEDFSSLTENPRARDGINRQTRVEETLGGFQQRQSELGDTGEGLEKTNDEIQTTASKVEFAVPNNMPRVLPTPYLNFIRQLNLFQNDVKQGSYRALPPEDFELVNEASILRRNPKFNLVLHEGWQQVVPPRAAPQQIYFTGNDSTSPLQGLVSVTLGRYLHFAGQLWLEASLKEYEEEQLLKGGDAIKTTLQPDLERMSVQVEPFAEALNEDALSDLAEPDLMTAPKTAYFELNESRRMRSKELHYLDHPAMGIIVKITPVEASLELVTAWADFEEYRKAAEQAQ